MGIKKIPTRTSFECCVSPCCILITNIGILCFSATVISRIKFECFKNPLHKFLLFPSKRLAHSSVNDCKPASLQPRWKLALTKMKISVNEFVPSRLILCLLLLSTIIFDNLLNKIFTISTNTMHSVRLTFGIITREQKIRKMFLKYNETTEVVYVCFNVKITSFIIQLK